MIGSFIQKLHQGVDPSRSLCNGGSGGGGGSSGVKYDNLEKLYGTQQQAAGFMLDQAMPRIPGILNNTEQMVGDAMSGALADQMRGRAAYDANQSIASSNNDAIRKLTSYGAAGDPSGGRFADVMNQNAFNSAKVRAGSMNTANSYAEDQKWNRNAGMYGQVSGMSTGAMQGMSSAGAGLSNLTAQQNQNAAANAQGFGQFGAAVGAAMTKANGGYIRKRRAPGLATGGDAWQAYKAANPTQTGGSGRRGYGIGQAAMQVIGGAAPHLIGAGVNDVMKGDKSAILKSGKEAYAALKAAPQMMNGAQNMSQAAEFADAAQASMDAGYSGAEALGMAAQGADYASSAQAAADAAEFADTASAASSAASGAEAAGTAFSASDLAWLASPMANGGMVRKKGRGLRFALGGGVRSPIAANGVDDMDASSSMKTAASGLSGAVNSGAAPSKIEMPKASFAESAEAGKDPIEQSAKSVVASQATKAAISEVAGAGTASAAGTGAGLAAGTGAGVTAGAAGTGAGLAAGTGAGVTAGAAGTGAGLAAGTGAGITAGTAGGVAAGVGGGAAAGATAGSIVPVVGTIAGAVVGALASRYLAKGGAVNNPIAKNGLDDMDASMSMPRVSQMDDKPSGLPSQAQQAAVDTRYMGKTDGMGETSAGDPDGFGKEGPDNRHMAGKATMSVIGRWLGGPLGGLAGSALAEVVHPVGEAVSRGAITTGDKAGGVSGAILMDPIGTSASGKYKPEDIAKGNLAIAAGVPWAGKFLADGGDVEPQQRADYTPGGAVRGPGTETSDDIPAWLSDGEVVHNADAVKLAGKDAMLAINDAGLQAREGKSSPEEAQQAIGKVMVQRGQQLLQGRRKVGGLKLANGGCAKGGKKYGLKLAGGGMLGNLGIALGAGVNQWNRQQALDVQQQQVDLAKAANVRAEEQASRAATEHEWKINDRKSQDDLRAELGGIEKRAQLGDTDAYMAGKQDEAKAAAALSGIDYQPLTEEQRKVIASAPGLGKMTPTLRYEMDMQRAAAYRKAGDAKTGEAYAEKATQRASGDAIQALLAKDARTFGKLYHVFPNGDTPDATEFDAEGNVVFDRGGQKEAVKRKDAILSALALHDPKTAASMFQNGELVQERLDNWMKAQEATNRLREQQMNARNDAAMARIAAGGSRSSGSGAGKDDGDPTASLLDRKKFNEAMGFKDEDGATADKAYSFYAQLAAANRKNGDLSAATNAELLRLSRDMATGGKKPAVDFDNNTLGFIHGVRDEGGNFRPLKSTGVRGDAIDTTTGQPFFDAKTIRTKELAGLDAFSKRDPKGFEQAARMSLAKSELELQEMAKNPQLAQFANAAILMQRYRDAPPTNRTAPGGGEAGPGVTGNRPGPFGMAADAFGGTLGFIKDGVRDALVNNLEGEHKWSKQPKPQ